MAPSIRRAGKWLALGLATLVALAVVYLAAGTIGGMIPANQAWRPAAQGITIWVEDNGVHTGLVLPKAAAGVDWHVMFPARDLRDPRYGGYDYIAVGWGERGFYLGTPTWSDVRPGVVLAAALGSDRTLVHVEHVPRPVAGPSVRAITLTPDQYRRLADYVRRSTGRGRAMRGYGDYDAFYPGTGRYDALHTCNDWTGRGLAHAGVRVGAWTPFSWSVMRSLR
jgi:uncharacterized protein (TIGR02117 family)